MRVRQRDAELRRHARRASDVPDAWHGFIAQSRTTLAEHAGRACHPYWTNSWIAVARHPERLRLYAWTRGRVRRFSLAAGVARPQQRTCRADGALFRNP